MPDHQAILAELPGLRRYARALTGHATAADDLVQDTLERALSRWRLWRPGNLRAWLFSIMHNQFVNQCRQDARQQTYLSSLDESHDELVDTARQHDAPNAQWQIEPRDLQRALRELAPGHREVLILIALENLSYLEAAQILQVPPGTVMSRLSRARAHLRRILLPPTGQSNNVLPISKTHDKSAMSATDKNKGTP